jgi:hypothetical protein
MRLPTFKVYRAFPELDRFRDEQCSKFVRSATRGFSRKIVQLVVQGLAFCLVLGIVVWLVNLLIVPYWTSIDTFRREPLGLILGTVILAVCLAISIVAAMFARDAWLIRGVRRAMFLRGACDACGYGLIGLGVDAQGRVTCPECGEARFTEPDLEEVAEDSSGVRRFLPTAEKFPDPWAWWTSSRVRLAKRVLIWGPVGFVLLVGTLLGLYEFVLLRQERSAAALRPSVLDLSLFVEAHQPEGSTAGEPNAWDALEATLNRKDEIDVALWGNTTFNDYDEFLLIYLQWPQFERTWYSYQPSQLIRARENSLITLDEYERRGVFELGREIVNRRRAVCPIYVPVAAPVTAWEIGKLNGECRTLTWANMARMHLAWERRDVQTFRDSLDQALAVNRILRFQLGSYGLRVASKLHGEIVEELLRVLSTKPEKEWVDAIRDSVAAQSARPTLMYSFEGERLLNREWVGWFFQSRDRVRWGKYSSAVASLPGASDHWEKAPLLFGTVWSNASKVEQQFEVMTRLALLEPYQRPPPASREESDEMTRLAGGLENLPSRNWALRPFDFDRLNDRAIRVAVALEEFRIANGQYPMDLWELVPTFLDRIPLDPCSGRPFVYCRDDYPAKGQGCLLYSLGENGLDDGGRQVSSPSWWWWGEPDAVILDVRSERVAGVP